MPEELKGGGEAVQAMIRQVEASWRSTRGGRAVDYAAIERAGHQAVPQGVEVDQPRVRVDGQR